jgi:hypothetical protein
MKEQLTSGFFPSFVRRRPIVMDSVHHSLEAEFDLAALSTTIKHHIGSPKGRLNPNLLLQTRKLMCRTIVLTGEHRKSAVQEEHFSKLRSAGTLSGG